jgi:hypothetical protein
MHVPFGYFMFHAEYDTDLNFLKMTEEMADILVYDKQVV